MLRGRSIVSLVWLTCKRNFEKGLNYSSVKSDEILGSDEYFVRRKIKSGENLVR